jgi:hypothetical protein
MPLNSISFLDVYGTYTVAVKNGPPQKNLSRWKSRSIEEQEAGRILNRDSSQARKEDYF